MTVDVTLLGTVPCRARTLVLTHYVPPMAPGDEDAWRALASAHFDGDVVLGDDLTTVSAP